MMIMMSVMMSMMTTMVIMTMMYTPQSQRRLSDTYNGGIGSFVMCTLIASFLQMRRRLVSWRQVPLSWNLGSLLVDFFAMFGGSFNSFHCGISLRSGGQFFTKQDHGDSEDEWFNPARS